MIKTSCLIAKFTALGTAVCLIIGLGIPTLLFPKALFPDSTNTPQTQHDQLGSHIYMYIVLPVAMILIAGFLVSQNKKNNHS